MYDISIYSLSISQANSLNIARDQYEYFPIPFFLPQNMQVLYKLEIGEERVAINRKQMIPHQQGI